MTTQPFGRSEPVVGVACAKAGLVWVAAAGHGSQPVWHVWHDDAVTVVVGGDEQPDPVPPGVGSVVVSVPSKDTRGRLLEFPATVERLGPVHPDWEAAVMPLQGGRLNAPQARDLLQRWTSGSTVLKLRQSGPVLVGPADDEPSGAAALRRSPATTVTWHPFHVKGRATRRRSR